MKRPQGVYINEIIERCHEIELIAMVLDAPKCMAIRRQLDEIIHLVNLLTKARQYKDLSEI